MSNFFRALRFAWPYRMRFLISVFCALAVAGFWGGNLSAVYPIVNVFFQDKNLQEWINGVVSNNRKEALAIQGQILLIEASPSVAAGNRANLAPLEYRLAALKLKAPWYQRAAGAIHKYLPSDRLITLGLVMLALIFGLAMKGLFNFFNEALVGSVTHLSMFDLKNEMFRHSLRMDLSTFHQQGSNELMARFTNDMETLASGVTTLLGKMIREPLKAVSCIILACWVNWQLTLVVLLLVPLAVVLMSIIGRLMRRATRRCLESMASIYGILQETFQSIKVVKAFTLERPIRNRFNKETRNYYHKSMRIVKLEALTSPAMEMIGVSAIVAAVMIGACLVIEKTNTVWGIRMSAGPMDQAALALLYAFLAGISDPARKLSNVYGRVQRASAAADRIFGFLDQQPKIESAPACVQLDRHDSHVEFRNVTFSYPGTKPVLTDVSLRVESGETIAIVGHNGCGKSTLVSLIPRFYDPQQGAVLIDGVPVVELDIHSIRKQIGMVTQETVLFNDSVENNIRYGSPDCSGDQLRQAAEQAYVHRFIDVLPEGYHTNLGERAVKLSGGQRQRIALARAMLRDPSILILDEATSALDVESEALIHRALEKFITGRTTFLITHRLSTLELADRIAVMDSGRIVSVGTHRELLSECELYRRLRELHSASRMSA